MSTDNPNNIIFKALSWYVNDNTILNDDFENLDVRYYIYGRTLDDKTISVEVKGFNLYFSILIPDDKDDNFIEKLYKIIKDRLSSSIEYNYNEKGSFRRNNGLVGYTITKKVVLYGYTANTKRKFLKLYFKSIKDYDYCRYLVSKEIKIYGSVYNFEIFESKVDNLVKFINTKKLQSAGYIKINNPEYVKENVNENENNENKESETDYTNYTDISITCDHKDVEKYDLELNRQYKIKVLSYDIETQSGDGESFPNPNNINDYIGVIGITTWVYGSENNEIKKYVITRGACSNVPDTIVYETKTEKELLIKYCDLIRELDPDIIVGYNNWGFDDKYVHTRMLKLNIDEYECMLSRTSKFKTKIVKKKLESSAYGHNEFEMYEYIGRDNIDLLPAIRKDHKLDSYSLNNVSKHFLNEHKDDLHPTEVFKYLEGSPDEMALVAKYCVQDTYLPIRLLKELYIISNSIEMANTSYVPNNWLLYRGQQCKAFSLIFKKCLERGFLINDKVPSDNSKFEGATVLEPEKQAHFVAVAGLDFASLYPSIMMAHNLDYTTLVLDKKYMNLPNVSYETIEIVVNYKDENGNSKQKIHSYTFVQDPDNSFEYEDPKNPFKLGKKIPKENFDSNKCYIGILPSILKDLKTGRSDTKKLMAKLIEENPENKRSMLYNIYNSKQLAQKVTMNSIYGFVGTGDKGVLPCKPIGACVTSRGRQMILFTRNKAEELYNCNAIYGDSVPASQFIYSQYEDCEHYTKIQIGNFACYSGIMWTPYVDNKEQINLHKEKKTFTTLSGSGPSVIKRVIRHKTNKKLYKIKARDSNGELREVIVTEGHSLITKDNKLIEAGNVKIGTELKEIL